MTATIEDLPKKVKPKSANIGAGGFAEDQVEFAGPEPEQLAFSIDEFSRAIMAKIVKKCGTRDYWEDWAVNIAEIARNHITRLTALLKDSDTKARKAFDEFLEELRDDLNESITESDAIEMLAQRVVDSVDSFSDTAPQSDDLTCLALRYAGNEGNELT